MTDAHLREWDLRKLRAGEAIGSEEAAHAHLASCAACGAKWQALEDEQRTVEAELPFERLARGVEARLDSPRRIERTSRRRWVGPAFALAACLALAVLVPQAFRNAGSTGPGPSGNRLKGGAEIEVRIAGPQGTPQRVVEPGTPEVLGPGERVRIGYRPGAHRYVAAVLVDAHGEVDPLYPASGRSLRAGAKGEMHYLPGSLELTGRGAKKVIVVLSDSPLRVAALERAAKAAFTKSGGDLKKLPALGVPGEQFQRTLLEP